MVTRVVIRLTYPYMHDGSVASVDDAVRIMFQQELGKKTTDAETQKIVTFLKTLTGEYNGQPLQ